MRAHSTHAVHTHIPSIAYYNICTVFSTAVSGLGTRLGIKLDLSICIHTMLYAILGISMCAKSAGWGQGYLIPTVECIIRTSSPKVT